MPIRDDITAFLNQEKIAFAGVSRDSKKFSNNIYLALRESGHKMYPINPNTEILEGDPCSPSIKTLPEQVSTLMIIASPKVALQVVKDTIGSGINRIWIFTGPGKNADLQAAIDQAKTSGITVISGLCPYLFLEPVRFPHSIHRFIMRLTGSYPR